MSEILIEPEQLQEEIASFKEANGAIDSSPYATEKGHLDLTAVNKYIDALEQMNQALTNFKNLSENDIQNLEYIRADWMNLDRELAGMTMGDRIFGSSDS